MCHISNFNRELNGDTKMGNGAKVQVSLNFPKKIGYQKVNYMIIWIPFENLPYI